MYYVSGMLAVIGAVSYHYFVRRVPASLSPVVAVIGIYIAVLLLGVTLLPFFPPEGGLAKHIRQLSWIQIGGAGSVFMLELGFILMYRHGWNISSGNLITGAIVNAALLGLGVCAGRFYEVVVAVRDAIKRSWSRCGTLIRGVCLGAGR